MWGRGTVLGGRYTLTERIGGGGMGDVWRAADSVLERQVAVKVLHPALLEDELFAERFRREARLLAALSHPGIVDVYDYGEGEPGSDEQRAYIVMELIDGQPLHEILAEEGAMPPSRALALVAQTLDALDAAHRRDIVHRDLKPSNLMLRSGDRVTVTDFGIARSTASTKITASHAVLGTALYMAPEQAEGGATTPLSDLYSVGVVCYELLTGQVPFTGETVLEIVIKHIREPAPQLPGLFPQVVRDFIATALAKRPEDRYPDAAAMAAAARAALKGGPATLPATTPVVVPVPEPTVAAGTDEPKTVVAEREPRRNWRRTLVPVIIPIIITTGAGTALLVDWHPQQADTRSVGPTPSLSRSDPLNPAAPPSGSAAVPPSAGQTPEPGASTPVGSDPDPAQGGGSQPGGTAASPGGQVVVPGGTTTVTAPPPNQPAPTRSTASPAPSVPADTAPAGCGGTGWSYITGVGSGLRLGLAADGPTAGGAVVMGGYTAYGWLRTPSSNKTTVDIHPCNGSKPVLEQSASSNKVQLATGISYMDSWRTPAASTAGAVQLKNYADNRCLTDNGAGSRVTMETCTPGNKSQEWRIS
ncbi:protein kinase domain-containing protein [Kitasatospora sp. P5_F3]